MSVTRGSTAAVFELCSGHLQKDQSHDQHVYKEYAHDIYYCTTYSPDNRSPKLITINKKVYTRFLDFIYMPCETHELSKEQCIAVNDIRNIYFDTHKDMSINRMVKQRISTVINQLCNGGEVTLLEYGCGYQTIHSLLNANISYIGADINPKTLQTHKTKDPEANFILVDEEKMPIRDKSIDVLVGVFVFHFNISTQQLSELFRMLSEDGVLIFNLYLLPKNQRKVLFAQLEAAGFYCHREDDTDRLLQEHEYCFLARNSKSLLLNEAITIFKLNAKKSSEALIQEKSEDTFTPQFFMELYELVYSSSRRPSLLLWDREIPSNITWDALPDLPLSEGEDDALYPVETERIFKYQKA